MQIYMGTAFFRPIDKKPVDAKSSILINQIGTNVPLHPDFGANAYWDDGKPFGIPFIVVSGVTPKVPVTFDISDQSDPGPYPIPSNAPIEGDPIQRVTGMFWFLTRITGNFMKPGVHTHKLTVVGKLVPVPFSTLLQMPCVRLDGWMSADAAGLPILPGLVRYDEVYLQKAINHAIRFTVEQTRRAYVAPARHFASSNTGTNLLPMGARLRLKASYDISTFPAGAGHYIGRVFELYEAVENGQGKIKVDDSIWKVCGEDCGIGTKVKVVAVDGTVFRVAPVGGKGPQAGTGL